MNNQDLSDMRARHDDYIARVKATGKSVVTFSAPCCGKDIETLASLKGERWDSVSTCPQCGALYIKITEGAAVTAHVNFRRRQG